ncbi:hypothetical protein Tco_0456053 [Tanacetum coccineum]
MEEMKTLGCGYGAVTSREQGGGYCEVYVVISQTTAISNIKLQILKKDEYDIWAIEMEHYLEYINNDVWKVIQNGNSKKRISTGKDEFSWKVDAKRKSGKDIRLGLVFRRVRIGYGQDSTITFFVGNYGASKYLTEDANHKFLRSLPPAWSNLAMTMRTKPDVDTLSIDDLYNNLRVFEQEIQGASKTSLSAQNVAFVSQSKSSTNKVKSNFTSTYSTCIPSTSSTNTPEKEALAGFAD